MAQATLSIRTNLGQQAAEGDKGPFLLAAVQGVEGFSIPYTYNLTLYRSLTDVDVDPSLLIDTPAKFGILHEDKYLTRCGVFRSFEKAGTTELKNTSQTDFVVYRARLVPAFAMLELEQVFRVFERMTAIEIIEEAIGSFANINVSHYLIKRFGDRTFPKIDYCVQYNETTLAFVSRLLGEYGIWYYFEHPAASDDHVGEQMVLGCGPGNFPACEEPKMEIDPRNFSRLYDVAHRKTRSGDYNPLEPTRPTWAEVKLAPGYDAAPADDATGLRIEREVFPAALPQNDPKGDAHALKADATYNQEAEEARVFTVQGQCDNRTFRVGRRFKTVDTTDAKKLPAGKDAFGPPAVGDFLVVRASISAMENALGRGFWNDVLNNLNPLHWINRPDAGKNSAVSVTAAIAGSGLWQSVSDEAKNPHWYDKGLHKLGSWTNTVSGMVGAVGGVLSVLTDAINEIIDRHGDSYSIAFLGVPWKPGTFALLPLPLWEPARAHGPQTAVVVGPSGPDNGTAELQVDVLNRVRVRFPWHTTLPTPGETDPWKTDRRTAWVRVAEGWAGQGMGTQFLPRIGDEVIVSFLDGDPARPLVTGRVYNAANRTMGHPFPPKRAAAETVQDGSVHQPKLGTPSLRSGIRTRSAPRPKGAKDRFHLLRFDDAWQDEQLLLRSQGRTDVTSFGAWHDTSHGSRHIRVGGKDPDTGKGGGALLVTTGDEHDFHVGAHRYEMVDKSLTLSVKQAALFDLQADHDTIVGGSSTLNASDIVLEAATKLTLKVGSSFVVLDPAGVYIKGAMVQINSGGSPGTTQNKDVAEPLEAGAADPGDPPDWLALHPPGHGGGRKHHTAVAQHGLLMARNPDGTLQVGRGIKIAGDPAYQQTVAQQLALMHQTNTGSAMIDNYQAGSHTMTIQPMTPPPNPPNAFARPDDPTAASNGTGSNSTVLYNPNQWPNPVNAPTVPGDDILFHEMTHAQHQGNGTQDMTPKGDNWDNNEEYNTIGPENQYRSERGLAPRPTITTCDAAAPFPSGRVVSGVAPASATLACQPTRDGDSLLFAFRLTNTGPVDIYAFDALPGLDPATGQPKLDPNAAVIALAGDGYAHVLRGIAPLPSDMAVAVRVLPLAARVPPGTTLERTLAIPQPLHETGPYHPDLPVRQYRQRDIAGVVLTVQYVPASAPGFSAAPSELAPGLFRINAADTIAATLSVSCNLSARGLTILQRTDRFPRPD